MAKQKTIVVNEKEYKLQHPGVLWYTRMTDRCTNRIGVIVKENYFTELLKNVIVDPQGITISSFDEDVAGLEEVIDEIERFLRSK